MQAFEPLSMFELDARGCPKVDALGNQVLVTPAEQAWRHRLNGYGSSFYLIKMILKRRRMTPTLHLPICQSLEKEHLKDGKEYPRDHFKTTIACEGMPIWRVLPFGDQDEDKFRLYHQLGIFRCEDERGNATIDEFIRWMRKIHNPYKRNLLVSETDKNARKLGTRIRRHFESNAFFRTFYPEIIPTSAERWTDTSLQIHIPGSQPNPHGEGTFDFIGVGGALQSTHYNGLLLQDDLVGRKAIESQSVMEKTIEYHRLLVGVFDEDDAQHESDELLIGNRWSFHDLNSYVKEHEPWFKWESHAALGGCCSLHPYGVPIFPEEFSKEKLEKLKKRLGSYHFSCQYLNNPCNPEDADFQEDWLNYFKVKVNHTTAERFLTHEVKDGVVVKDSKVSHLRIVMVSDPTHSKNADQGRCRHSIVVVGMNDEGNYYLLDCWAQKCSYDAYFQQIFAIAKRWGLHRTGFETSAGQGFAAYHIEFLSQQTGWRLKVEELKGEVELGDGSLSHKKEFRIRDTVSPIAEFGRLWVQRKHQDFLAEYNSFPRGTYVDILDALAYVPQLLRNPMNQKTRKQMLALNRQMSNLVGAPYSAGAQRQAVNHFASMMGRQVTSTVVASNTVKSAQSLMDGVWQKRMGSK